MLITKFMKDNSKARQAHEDLDSFVSELLYEKDRKIFNKKLNNLLHEVADAAELKLMRGENRFLGQKHMLLSDIYSALSLCSKPVQREASFKIVKNSLDRYLGITFKKQRRKRKRRKLLPDV